MKKVLSVLLVFMILTTLSLNAVAYSPSVATTLTQLNSIPDASHLISAGLSSSQVYSNPTAAALSEEQKADVADINYGISCIGVEKNLARPISGASDGVWSNYNSGGTVLDNNMNSKGACKFLTAPDTYYNVNGEIGEPDSRYIFLLTYNFGKMMDLEAFGFFAQNANSIIRAADIYISNDAEHWTLVGKYDGNQARMDGTEFTTAGTSPKDAADNPGTTAWNVLWSLEGHSARYVRIAAVKGIGQTGTAGDYDSYSKDPSSGSGIDFRELVIFGTETDYSSEDAIGVVYRGVQNSAVSNGTYNVRFIGTVNSLNATEIGFRISAVYGEDAQKNYHVSCSYVYKTLLGSDEVLGIVKRYTAQELGGKYIYALSIVDIPADIGEITFTVTPYVISNGEDLEGSSYQVIYNAGQFIIQTLVNNGKGD